LAFAWRGLQPALNLQAAHARVGQVANQIVSRQILRAQEISLLPQIAGLAKPGEGAKLALGRQNEKERRCNAPALFFCPSNGSGVIGISVPLGLPKILLGLALELFTATLDVLAGVVGGITDIAADASLHFLGGSFDLVLETAFV